MRSPDTSTEIDVFTNNAGQAALSVKRIRQLPADNVGSILRRASVVPKRPVSYLPVHENSQIKTSTPRRNCNVRPFVLNIPNAQEACRVCLPAERVEFSARLSQRFTTNARSSGPSSLTHDFDSVDGSERKDRQRASLRFQIPVAMTRPSMVCTAFGGEPSLAARTRSATLTGWLRSVLAQLPITAGIAIRRIACPERLNIAAPITLDPAIESLACLDSVAVTASAGPQPTAACAGPAAG